MGPSSSSPWDPGPQNSFSLELCWLPFKAKARLRYMSFPYTPHWPQQVTWPPRAPQMGGRLVQGGALQQTPAERPTSALTGRHSLQSPVSEIVNGRKVYILELMRYRTTTPSIQVRSGGLGGHTTQGPWRGRVELQPGDHQLQL